MACLEQLDEDYKLNPISQPELDVEAIELPDDGPMTFEMDVEVRPDFPLPAYKALTVKGPVRTITEADIDAQVKAFRERYAQLVPKLEGGAEVGDFVTADLAFHKDGSTLQRGQGDPVPAPAGAAVPGRHASPTSTRSWSASSPARSARPTPRSARRRPTRASAARRSRSPSTSSTSRSSACPSSTRRSSTRPASTPGRPPRGPARGPRAPRSQFQQRQAVRREILDQAGRRDAVRPAGRPRRPAGEVDPPPPGPWRSARAA